MTQKVTKIQIGMQVVCSKWQSCCFKPKRSNVIRPHKAQVISGEWMVILLPKTWWFCTCEVPHTQNFSVKCRVIVSQWLNTIL